MYELLHCELHGQKWRMIKRADNLILSIFEFCLVSGVGYKKDHNKKFVLFPKPVIFRYLRDHLLFSLFPCPVSQLISDSVSLLSITLEFYL